MIRKPESAIGETTEKPGWFHLHEISTRLWGSES